MPIITFSPIFSPFNKTTLFTGAILLKNRTVISVINGEIAEAWHHCNAQYAIQPQKIALPLNLTPGQYTARYIPGNPSIILCDLHSLFDSANSCSSHHCNEITLAWNVPNRETTSISEIEIAAANGSKPTLAAIRKLANLP